MFSVIFPGQGSQLVGMGKDLYSKYSLIQNLFKEADDTLGFSLSNLILNGPKDELDLTENTQPAIFLVSYSIYKLITEEFNIDLNKESIDLFNIARPNDINLNIAVGSKNEIRTSGKNGDDGRE